MVRPGSREGLTATFPLGFPSQKVLLNPALRPRRRRGLSPQGQAKELRADQWSLQNGTPVRRPRREGLRRLRHCKQAARMPVLRNKKGEEMLTEDQLKEIENRANAATPGMWRVSQPMPTPAKRVNGLKPVSRVRIPPSPPESRGCGFCRNPFSVPNMGVFSKMYPPHVPFE